MVVSLVSLVPITLLNYIYVFIPVWFLNWCPFSVWFFSFQQQLPAKHNGYNKYTDVIYLKELFADIITLLGYPSYKDIWVTLILSNLRERSREVSFYKPP